MLRLRSLISATLCLAATAASALNVSLTPETPLSPPAFATAPYDQRMVGLASDGSSTLAVWFDRRSTIPAQRFPPATAPLYAFRIDGSGNALTPFGLKIRDDVFSAALVGLPGQYVLLFSTIDGGVYWMTLDVTGKPSSDPRRIAEGYVYSAVTNGSTVLVIHGTNTQPNIASLFSTQGTFISRTALGSTSRVPQAAHPVALPDGRYGILMDVLSCNGVTPCTFDETFTTIPGNTTDLRILQGPTQSAIAVGTDRIAVVSVSDIVSPPTRNVTIRFYDLNGNPLTNDIRLESTNNPGTLNAGLMPSIGWDGHEFLATYQWLSPGGQSGEIHAVRVTPDGHVLDLTPQLLWGTLGRPPLYLTVGSSVIAAWDTALVPPSDIAWRSASSFDTLLLGFVKLGPQSATLQLGVQIAAIGANRLAVWREGESNGAIAASSSVAGPFIIAQPTSLDVQAPTVGAGSNSYLVAWRQGGRAENGVVPVTILAARVSANGTVVDANPIVIATDIALRYVSGADTLAVASDGTNFLVAWPADGDQLHAARVSGTGQLLDRNPVILSTGAIGTPGSPRVVWNGKSYVVAWTADPSCKVCLSPPGPPTSLIFTVNVSSSGAVIGAPTQVATTGFVNRLGLARGSTGLMAAWGDASDVVRENICIDTLPLTETGAANGSVQKINCAASNTSSSVQYPDVDVAWDTGSFVVAWTEVSGSQSKAQAMRVSSSGVARDAAPFAITNTGDPSFEPALATSANGVFIAYERIGSEAMYGSVSRAFVRELFRADTPAGRHRAASSRP